MSTGHPTHVVRAVNPEGVDNPQFSGNGSPCNYGKSAYPSGCLPLPGGDAILTRLYVRRALGISFNTLTKWACDHDDPLPTYGADTKNILIFASDLAEKIKSRGPNTKASRTAAHHAKRRQKKKE